MNTFKTTTIATLLASAFSAMPALAEEAAPDLIPEYTFMDAIKDGANMSSLRLRYENVDQDGISAEANAFTLRTLIGWQTAPFHNFSIAGQLINVSKFDESYNDRANNNTQGANHLNRAIVADPDYTGINQLYLDWTGIRNTKVRLGRQSLKLDNVRFIGNVEFRQVMQVFDGVSVENKSIPDTELFGAYFTGYKNIFTQHKDDNVGILHATYRISGTENLNGYGYFYDQENVTGAANLSSKTFGARLDGIRVLNPVNPDWKVRYTVEYAKQTDYKGSSSNVDAHYYKIGGGGDYGNFWIRADQELLSSNNGKYAFQTPLGTNHLFQGWVDKFLTTPNQGIEDTYITAGYKIFDITFLSEYHWFRSDVNFAKVGGGVSDKFGKEWDISAAYNINKQIATKIEYGTFKEDDQRATAAGGRIRDTDKLWLTAMYTF